MTKQLKLVIGDKNLSSWSMRAWLVAKASELPFEEILIPLDQPNTSAEIRKYSPSLKVPCLIHEDLRVWDSLAISEYIAELAPNKKLWPSDPQLKAMARSYACEMHSGFTGLRSQLSMDLSLKMQIRHLSPQTINDIQRILTLWTDALNLSKGPFLFGDFGIADAFYAPVVFRFISYGIHIESPLIKNYMNHIERYPHVQSWYAAALTEKFQPFIFKQP